MFYTRECCVCVSATVLLMMCCENSSMPKKSWAIFLSSAHFVQNTHKIVCSTPRIIIIIRWVHSNVCPNQIYVKLNQIDGEPVCLFVYARARAHDNRKQQQQQPNNSERTIDLPMVCAGQCIAMFSFHVICGQTRKSQQVIYCHHIICHRVRCPEKTVMEALAHYIQQT